MSAVFLRRGQTLPCQSGADAAGEGEAGLGATEVLGEDAPAALKCVSFDEAAAQVPAGSRLDPDPLAGERAQAVTLSKGDTKMPSERDVVDMPKALNLGAIVNAPASPAARAGGLVFTTGYMAIDPSTGELSAGTIEHETRLTLECLRAVLEAAGSSLAKVAKVHVFLADIERDFDGMNRVYTEFFEAPYPARRTVQAKLIRGLKVEIEAIAGE